MPFGLLQFQPAKNQYPLFLKKRKKTNILSVLLNHMRATCYESRNTLEVYVDLDFTCRVI